MTTFPTRLFCANRENVLDASMGTMSASAEAKFLPDSISIAFARRFADDDAFADTSAEFMNSSLARSKRMLHVCFSPCKLSNCRCFSYNNLVISSDRFRNDASSFWSSGMSPSLFSPPLLVLLLPFKTPTRTFKSLSAISALRLAASTSFLNFCISPFALSNCSFILSYSPSSSALSALFVSAANDVSNLAIISDNLS